MIHFSSSHLIIYIGGALTQVTPLSERWTFSDDYRWKTHKVLPRQRLRVKKVHELFGQFINFT